MTRAVILKKVADRIKVNARMEKVTEVRKKILTFNLLEVFSESCVPNLVAVKRY